MVENAKILEAVVTMRKLQKKIYECPGFSDSDKSIAHWLLYMEEKIDLAKKQVMGLNRDAALKTILGIAALAVGCLENKLKPDELEVLE